MIINLLVKPNSKFNKIDKINDSDYVAYVKEPAENNKANIALIKLISKYFNTSHRNIIIKNPLSRNKIIEIQL
jgi:uncharacterized protein